MSKLHNHPDLIQIILPNGYTSFTHAGYNCTVMLSPSSLETMTPGREVSEIIA